ncbi:MAG: alpha/beta fold hydrolase [Alphaproteobacteria bacterium]|nr:alpha/beta fold hydrolase [Alphaproteobacteria bacterium]MCW5744365.1 alpha/beta fold hydrolase [Alphaproteobacteria bacterium]
MLRGALRALVVLAVALGVAGHFGLPILERHLTFFPLPADPARPWTPPAGAQDVFFDSAPGITLHGWYWRADPAKPAPITVLYSHGNADNVVPFAVEAARLAAAGFDVLLFDYRGYGRSAGISESEATLISDGRAALDYLVRLRGVPPESIAHYGYSLGSVLAAELAVSHPCRAVVLLAPLASMSAHISLVLPWLPQSLHGLARNRFDTVGKIARASCPVMVIHGDRDEVIDAAQGRAVWAAAREPKRLMVIPGGPHWLGSAGNAHVDAAAEFIRSPHS